MKETLLYSAGTSPIRDQSAEDYIMNTSLLRILRFLKSEDGPAAIEYAVLLAAILLAALSGIVLVGEATSQKWTDSSGDIQLYFH